MSPQLTKCALALVAIVVLALAMPSLRNGFAMDDRLVAKAELDTGQRNALVAEVRPLAEYLTTNYHHGTGNSTELYRPVTILSYALVHALPHPPVDAEGEAWRQHAVNVALHVLATLLVFALVRAAGGGALGALLGALAFGVHALHSEVVAGIVGRAELLAFCLGSSAALLLRHARQTKTSLGECAAVTGSAALLLLALGSKESALGWLVLAPLLFAWPQPGMRPRLSRCQVVMLLAGLAVPAAAFLGLRQMMVAGLPQPPEPIEWLANPLAQAPADQRVLTAITLWGLGLAKTLLPWSLYADYGPATFDLVDSPLDGRFLASAIALTTVAVGALVVARRQPLLLLAAAAFLAFSAVTSNLVRPIGTIFAERLYYAPSLGVAMLVAALAPRFERRPWRLYLPLAAWCLWNAGLLLAHHGKWQDDATLFLHEANANPRAVRMQVCAAEMLLRHGDAVGSETMTRRALELCPDLALAWNNLGVALLNQDRLDEAEAALRQALTARRPMPAHQAALPHANLDLVERRRAALSARRPSSPPR